MVHLGGPPVLGYLGVGLVLGHSGLGLVEHSRSLHTLAELGVVFLLFASSLIAVGYTSCRWPPDYQFATDGLSSSRGASRVNFMIWDNSRPAHAAYPFYIK